nr:zinc finger protein 770 isoform X2 [Parasteatoda tepidariorum]
MMKRNEGECSAKNKRRLSLPDQSQQQASTSTSLSKKRKVSHKAEKASGSMSVKPAKISKNKANLQNRHVCNKCMKVFEDSFDVVAHECTSFKCSVCHKNLESDIHLKNHELTHKKVNDGAYCLQCKFCSTKLDLPSSLAKHEALCKKRNFKQCNMCDKKMHPRSKHEFCKKCILLIDKSGKDYSLRRNSKDRNQSTSLVSVGIAENRGGVSTNQLHTENINTGKINRSKKSKNCLSSESNATEIQGTSITQNNLSDDIDRSDTHIHIRKTFNKPKKMVPDKNINISENSGEAVPDETSALFKKPESVTSVKSKSSKVSNNNSSSSKKFSNNNSSSSNTEKTTRRLVRKNMGNVLLEGAVAKSKQLTEKQNPLKPVKVLIEKKISDVSPSSSVQNKAKEGDSSKAGYASSLEIKIESLIDSLPDPNSGILLKCFGNKIDYQCVKCCKQFGNVELACIHFSCCKIKFIRLKKQFTSLNNVLWFCTLCNSSFDLIADLLKHKTSCSLSGFQDKSDNGINPITVNQKYDEKFLNKCNKCGFTCFSSITLEKHPCEESVKLMSNCFVKVDNLRNLELKAKNVTYYHCKMCKKDFLNPKAYDGHMRDKHRDVYDGILKPLSLQIGKITKAVKQEPNYNEDQFYDSTPMINQTPSLESIFSLPSLSSNLEEPEGLRNQLSSANLFRYRIPQVFETAPLDGENAKRIIGCNHDPDESGLAREDTKPCIACLQLFSANYAQDNRNDFKTQNSNSGEELQAQLSFNYAPRQTSHSTASDHQPRSFPTPPATPDSIYCQSQSSQTSESQASSDSRFNNSDELQNSIQIETLSLKLSWDCCSDKIDAFAILASEDKLSISKYICASCYTDMTENDVCEHMHRYHDKNSGQVNVSCIKAT